MRVRIHIDSLDLNIEIDGWRSTSTLGDLISAVGGPLLDPSTEIYIDTQRFAAADTLEDLPLLEGSRIARTPLETPLAITGWSVSISGGLSSGGLAPLVQGRPMIFGRSPHADLVLDTQSASWEHLSAEITADGVQVKDAGSTNGTFVSGTKVGKEGITFNTPTTVQAGGVTLFFQPQIREYLAPKPGSLHNLTPARTAPFNRPPRQALPKLPEEVTPPKRKEVISSARFNIALIVAPIIMAGAMVVMLGSFRYAVFALLSPVMMIGNWLEQKHRYAKEVKEEDERFEQALTDFKEEVGQKSEQEIARINELIPDLAGLTRRASLPTTELWKRRFDAADFLLTRVATGNMPWQPELDSRSRSEKLDPDVQKTLDENTLYNVPIMANLNNAGVVGIVGEREGALAVARSLVLQLSTSCGPADMTLGVFCDQGKEQEWAWTSWIPQTRQATSATGGRWISSGRNNSSEMLRFMKQGIDSFITPAVVLVLDSEVLTEGRDAPARDLLGNGRTEQKRTTLLASSNKQTVPVSGIVIASAEEQLPAACTTIVRVRSDADADIFFPETRNLVKDAVISGAALKDAERLAMNLAHFDDPEFTIPGASLPHLVQMPELLGLTPPDSPSIQTLWQTRNGISAPVGIGDDGEYMLDLVKDGPHGLVGGTTGSGKSEFLRTFVAGLAARNSPEDLNFILIDFKGGAAFKACERLPHTIGTISNLDEQLADRALRALDAEMDRRQRLFAEAGEGVDNIKDYMASNPAEPMPRILLVIDEFAMLAKDFPDVLQSLVNVAAVGRTLGVHMILATQRPAGVVNNDILANTNLRVALRVQSKEDSTNVIGVPDASSISRSQMGRAYIKLGQEDISAVQTALVTGQTEDAGQAQLSLRESSIFGVPLQPLHDTPRSTADDNDLDVLIDAVLEANSDMGLAEPRQVWPEALGARVALKGLSENIVTELGKVQQPVGDAQGQVLQVGLADQPHLQRQVPAGWNMGAGNLLLIGIPGSGTTTTLGTIALTAALNTSPEELDIAVLDLGAGGLSALKSLPHTVAYVGSGGRAQEQRARFFRFLVKELERRRTAGSAQKKMLVLVDGLASLRDEYDDFDGQALLQLLYRAYAEGVALGMHFAVSTTRIRSIPTQINEVTTQRWVYQLSDNYDYASNGIKGKDIPAPVPGRCVQANTLQQMHIATPDTSLADAVRSVVACWPAAGAKPDLIGQLPTDITVAELGVQSSIVAEPWRIPVGMGEQNLEPVFLEVYEGEHILVAGPARSGKSRVLLALAESLRGAEVAPNQPAPEVWVICGRRSPLAQAGFEHIAVGEEEVAPLVAQLRLARGPAIVLIDDADSFADGDKSIAGLVEKPHPGLCVIAAGRSDELRSLYNHWTKAVRKSKCGVLLQPNLDFDGDLLGAKLPRKSPVEISAGRGFAVCAGAVQLVQTVSSS